MTAKISPRHRQAFIEALAESGNYAIAAAEVRVSRDWAFRLRRRDEAFDAACREAVRLAQDRPRREITYRPLHRVPRSPSPANAGEEMVIQRGNGRRVQVKRARPDQWTEETAHRFLAALAGTCNVGMAAAVVGTSQTSAYARRRLDPGFARAWAEALEIGYVRLQANLFEATTCFFEGEPIPDENPIRSMTVAEAIQSLNMHKFAVRGEGRGRPGRR